MSQPIFTKSAKLTEFQKIKDAVKELERTTAEQLALENESQQTFEFIKKEVVKVKKSIGALSNVVDSEIANLRAEAGELREAVKQLTAALAVHQESTTQSMVQNRQRDTEWMTVTTSTVKENLQRLDADVKEIRQNVYELSQFQSSSLAQFTQDAKKFQETYHRETSATKENLGSLDSNVGGLRHHINELLDAHKQHTQWRSSTEAAIRNMATRHDKFCESSTKQLLDTATRHQTATQTLAEQLQSLTALRLPEMDTELVKHRDAIVLLVETCDNIANESRVEMDGFNQNVTAQVDAMERQLRQQDKAIGALNNEHNSLRDHLKRADGKTSDLHEQASLLKVTSSQHAEWIATVEKDVLQMKQDGQQQVSQVRSLKNELKDSTDNLNAHKAQMRRAGEEAERRQEAHTRAAAVFSEVLKISNPLMTLNT